MLFLWMLYALLAVLILLGTALIDANAVLIALSVLTFVPALIGALLLFAVAFGWIMKG